MRVAVFVNTPAQAHTWRHVVVGLMHKGHEVRVFARDYDGAPELLKSFGLPFEVYIRPTKSKYLKALQLGRHVARGVSLSKSFSPQIVIGFGVTEAVSSILLQARSVIFTDSETVPLQNALTGALATAIITPDCFRGSFGPKHVRVSAYKEMFYLHPRYFRPDPSVLSELGVGPGERYAVVRFNAFDAVHDVGRKGFSLGGKLALVSRLGELGRVFVSSESPLPSKIAAHLLPIPKERIHHVLHFASLLVTDTQTMATEAALLGTPVVRCNSFVGQNDMGNFVELEQKYGLVHNFRDPEKAIDRAVEIFSGRGISKEEALRRRAVILKDKIDVTSFMVWFIENYPDSFHEMKKNPDIQYRFR